jgi:hypothetical protein
VTARLLPSVVFRRWRVAFWILDLWVFFTVLERSSRIPLGSRHIAPLVAPRNGKVGVVVDDAALDEQTQALERILSGQEGGTFGELAQLITEFLGTERGTVSFSDGETPTGAVGDRTEINFEPSRGVDGLPTTVKNTAYGFASEYRIGTTTGRSDAFGLPFSPSYGEHADFEFSSQAEETVHGRAWITVNGLLESHDGYLFPQKMVEAWNSGNVKDVGEMYASDVCRFGTPWFLPRWMAATPSFNSTEACSPLSPRLIVALELQVEATNSAPIPSPTGLFPPPASALLWGVSLFKLNDKGGFAEERRYFDTGSFFAQFGLGI